MYTANETQQANTPLTTSTSLVREYVHQQTDIRL